MWKNKSLISDEERDNFIQALDGNQELYDKLYERNESAKKTNERHAIEKSLVDAGYLVIKRRRISSEDYDKKETNLT